MMNKHISKVIAMGVFASSLVAPVAVHADVVMSDGNTSINSKAKAKSGEASVVISDGKDSDLNNPGGSDVQNGPKITVKQDKFLLLRGSSFDFKSALGLSVTDEKDGDLTNKFEFPELDTSKTKAFTKTITATNSEGKASTKTLVFRIIDVKSSIDVESKEALQTMDLKQVIEGDTDGLTVKLGTVTDSTFTVTISDGTNSIEREIKYNVKESSTGKDEAPKPSEEGTAPGTTDGTPNTTTDGTTNDSTASAPTDEAGTGTSTDLPKTGVAGPTLVPAIGLVTAICTFFKARH